MQYKIYSYTLEDRSGRLISPDKQYEIFEHSTGYASGNRLATYRGKNDAILMHVRKYGSDFAGRIGKHATEREVTEYNTHVDEAREVVRADDDYPHTLFICFPRLKTIAIKEGGTPSADSAVSRLHAILIQRASLTLTCEALRAPLDLRRAVERFRVTEVTFEVLPVNPHTGRLGRLLDMGNGRDHVKKLKGKAEATRADPIQLNNGIVTAIQQLQSSGHAKAGFRGYTDDGVEVIVPKPKETREFGDIEDESRRSEEIDVKLFIPETPSFPFQQSHVTAIRTAIRRLTDNSGE